jgi:hypothetical protein
MSKTNGTRFIDKLVAASPTARRKFTLLGQDVYFKPMTRKELAEAMPKDKMQRAPDYDGLFLLVHAAEAEDGSKLFQRADIETLRNNVSLELLQQLEAALLGGMAPSQAQVQAEADADPHSASA